MMHQQSGCVVLPAQPPEDIDMTCDGCQAGIQATIDQLASEEALDLLLNYFASIDFCGGDESCPAILEWVLRSAAPFFAAAGPALGGQEDFTQVCNIAKPGTCAAKKMSLF